ncbi:MAG: type I-C CRISPR-associated endonuclease Cas1c [Verrucomicrobiota bacterium]
MKRHLNTLFVTTEGAWLRKDGQAVAVDVEKETKLRVPLHNLDGIVALGWDIGMSPQLMAACAEADVAISFHNPHGKFLAAVRGPVSGNVLLRREQYRQADDEAKTLKIAAQIVAVKIMNCRTVLVRAARETSSGEPAPELEHAIRYLGNRIDAARSAANPDSLRGIEGEAATAYFGVFQQLLKVDDPAFVFERRSKRPPLNRINALLSFLYAMLTHDLRSALEGVGLDPQVGFLHRDRPGRPSLALDLMEEFRAYFADRLALSLINRQQLQAKDFRVRESGAVQLKDDARKLVLKSYQERKQKELRHPFLDEKMTLGLLPHIQARLFSRYLRGDLDIYPPFIWKG